MVTYVLDASAVLRLLDDEAGAVRVREILKEHLLKEADAVISAVHWGEVTGTLYKRHGVNSTHQIFAKLRALNLLIVPVQGDTAEAAARIKTRYKIPYVDSFAVELTASSPNRILITADFDMKPAEHLIQIEFLPTKPTP